jgi:hypothetical protein
VPGSAGMAGVDPSINSSSAWLSPASEGATLVVSEGATDGAGTVMGGGWEGGTEREVLPWTERLVRDLDMVP